MSSDTQSRIEAVLDRYVTIRTLPRKRSIGNLIRDPQDFARFLSQSLSDWQQVESNLRQLTNEVTSQDILSDQISSSISSIALEVSHLLDILDRLKRTIGPITFEDIHEELSKEVEKAVRRFETLLQCVVGQFPADRAFLEHLLRTTRLQNTLQPRGMGQIQRRIARAASRPLPDPRHSYRRRSNPVSRALLDFKNHLWIQSTIILVILFLAFAQSGLGCTLLTWQPWIRVLAWGITIGLVLRSLWRRNWRALFSLSIVGSVALLWSYGLLPGIQHLIEPSRTWAKLILWLTVLLWFPTQFLSLPKRDRIAQLIVLAILWSGILAFWAYGIVKGLVVSLALLVFPVARLLGSSRREQRRLSRVLNARLYLPTAIVLFLTAFLVTQEDLWFRATVIWILFSITATHSYRYFRRTYDLIEEIFPDAQNRQRRHQLVFLSLVISSLLLVPGILGKLDHALVTDLYLQAAGLAFGLITILLAVQAIVPGITTWSRETNLIERLREMRAVLRANAGLQGFMQWFFLLFLFSLFGWLVTTRFLTNQSVVVDLSFDSAFTSSLGLPNLLRGSPPVDTEDILISLSTLLFSAFVYAVAYGIAQLYYLFIAANTLTLPIRDSLLSTPIVVQHIRIDSPDSSSDNITKKKDEIEAKLKQNRDLNGIIVGSLVVRSADEKISTIEWLLLEIEMDYVELDELHAIVRKSLTAAFGLGQVQAADLIVFRRTYSTAGRQKAFSLQIDREEWEFLREKLPGFPFDYKLSVLGASTTDYILAESQIA